MSENAGQKCMIIELEPGVWLVAWRPGPDPGDPQCQAVSFADVGGSALSEAQCQRPFPNARVVNVRVKVVEEP